VSSRREAVPFDTRYFEKLARRGDVSSAEAIFGDIYRRNHWAGTVSPSGLGASPDQTTQLRAVLPDLLRPLRLTRCSICRAGTTAGCREWIFPSLPVSVPTC
jgi:hypothetical protein